MRLINCKTFEFEEYYQPEGIQYAILSHRWEDDEVNYRDMQDRRELLHEKKGYQKIQSFCTKALEQNITYIWVDTCCINKDSSAELSEAINSMYAWYHQSVVCHVYLHDLKEAFEYSIDSDIDFNVSVFRECAWFYRGWTLQELIAPQTVLFYNSKWRYIGSKADMAMTLSRLTMIPEDVLSGEIDIQTLTIAERMTWAGERQCTRLEDTAYSLLGIFDVNMPMLYGEGPKAFKRLQEEIIKQTNDQSIFLWDIDSNSKHSMLAPHPSAFKRSWEIYLRLERRRSFTITNSGLAINLLMQPYIPGVYLALFDCNVDMSGRSGTKSNRLGIFLKRNSATHLYERVILGGFKFGSYPPEKADSYIQRRMDITIDLRKLHIQKALSLQYGFYIGKLRMIDRGKVSDLKRLNVHSFSAYQEDRPLIILPDGEAGIVGVIEIVPHHEGLVNLIKLGFDFDFQPVCILKLGGPDPTIQTDRYGLFGDHLTVGSRVSNKKFHNINCLEELDWITNSTTEPFNDLYGNNTLCLKPPKQSAGFNSSHGTYRLRESHHVIKDQFGNSWRLEVSFKRQEIIWRFDMAFYKGDIQEHGLSVMPEMD